MTNLAAKKIQLGQLLILILGLWQCNAEKTDSTNSSGARQSATSTENASTQNSGNGGTQTSSSAVETEGDDAFQKLLSGIGSGSTTSTASTTNNAANTGSKTAPAADPNAITPRFAKPYQSMRLNEYGLNYLSQEFIEGTRSSYEHNTSKKNEVFSNNASTYECPGNSLLIGLVSNYNRKAGTVKDRAYQAICQFFNDGLGEELQRSNCQNYEGAKAGSQSIDPAFQCPDNKIMGGFFSAYVNAKGDRTLNFSCCDVKRKDGTAISFLQKQDTEGNKEPVCEPKSTSMMLEAQGKAAQRAAIAGNANYGVTNFACQGKDSALYKISGYFVAPQNKENDRVLTFECCQLGAMETAPPVAQP
jgi:hypothetical protein